MTEKLIRINRDTCTSCGICVQVCPAGVLTMKDDFPFAHHPGSCIFCAHCAAVCPEGALIHRGEMAGTFTLTIPDPDDPEDFYATKRSIRRYMTQKVDPPLIRELIRMAETAPSGHNARKRRYHIVDTGDAIQKLEKITADRFKRLLTYLNPIVTGFLSVVSPRKTKKLMKDIQALKRLIAAFDKGHNPFYRGAPCVILISAPKKQRSGRDDCVSAMQYLMLNAHRRGLGSCIIGFALYARKNLEKHLQIPKNRHIYAVMVLGYAKYTYKKAIYRGIRNSEF
jgi:nitroreductase/NAD-dependent dihydropyrimidine dehydrogenase PreA subunit